MADEEKQEETQEEAAAPAPAPAPAPTRPAPLPALGPSEGLLGITVDMAKSMLVIGIVFVLLARGCDSLSNRKVSAAQASLKIAQSEFTEKWDGKAIDAAQDIREIEDKIKAEKKDDEPDKEDIEGWEKDLKELEDKAKELGDEKGKATQEFQEGDLRELQAAAGSARAYSDAGGWWREAFFLIGTLAVTLAVTSIGFQSTGPERVVSLIILAIITFSIYIGGIAWLSTAMQSVR